MWPGWNTQGYRSIQTGIVGFLNTLHSTDQFVAKFVLISFVVNISKQISDMMTFQLAGNVSNMSETCRYSVFAFLLHGVEILRPM